MGKLSNGMETAWKALEFVGLGQGKNRIKQHVGNHMETADL